MTPSPLSPSPLSSHPTQPTHKRTFSQTHIIIPSLHHTATRLQCLSNYKLRIESSRNDPQLRNLLGHISIYDAVREHRRAQISLTAFPAPPQSTTPTQRHQCTTSTSPSNELQEYLSLQKVRVPSFTDFQAAIEMQLATLTEIQGASKRLQALSQNTPTIDEEECDSESESDSDYDSYDSEGDWRDDEEDEGDSEDSMTDPESVASECSSPVEEKREEGLWAVRPLTPLMGTGVGVAY